VLSLWIAACTQPGGDGGPSMPPNESQGLWFGTLTYANGDESPVRLIVDPGGSAYFVPLSGDLEPLPYEHHGSMQCEEGTVSGDLWRSVPGSILSVDVVGSGVPRAWMAIDLHGTGILDGAHVALEFDPQYERGSSISRVQGSWFLGGLSLDIHADGSISGSDLGGSTYSGAIYAPWPSVDVYTIDLGAHYPWSPFPYEFDGIATLIDGNAPSSELFATMIGFSSLFSPTVYWSPRFER
jgi:hypothetical protein